MLYDRIGRRYGGFRHSDPRFRLAIEAAIGAASSFLDVGSGTGSYEPGGRAGVALEPSSEMIAQRPSAAAPVVRGVAEALPIRDGAVDVGLAILTVHHWADFRLGLRELARVSDRQVVLPKDAERFSSFWLLEEYLPDLVTVEAAQPGLVEVAGTLDVERVVPLPVPADCVDGFCAAYWRRPWTYLDPDARGAISGFAGCDPGRVAAAVGRLREDLRSGAWFHRHRGLMDLAELDLGYRLVVARGAR